MMSVTSGTLGAALVAVLSTVVSLIWITALSVAALKYDLAPGRNPQKADPKIPCHE